MTDKGYYGPARSNGQVHENGAANGHDSGSSLMILDSTPVPAEEMTDGRPDGEAPANGAQAEEVAAPEEAHEEQAQAAEAEVPLEARGDEDISERPRAEKSERGIDSEAEEHGDADEAVEEAPAEVPPLFTDEDRWRHLRMGEALLFASAEPLSTRQIAERLPDGADVERVLADLAETYANRGVNLVRVAGGWAFRTATDLAFLMERERVEQKKLSRAALETLAIIAYHQPVTRAEIEDVRGVSVSKGTLDVLMEAGWVRVRGRRQTPGRPVTYGTSDAFLEHFGLDRVSDLPGMDELKAAGLLDSRMPTNISIPKPSDDEESDAEDSADDEERDVPADTGGADDAGDAAAFDRAETDGEGESGYSDNGLAHDLETEEESSGSGEDVDPETGDLADPESAGTDDPGDAEEFEGAGEDEPSADSGYGEAAHSGESDATGSGSDWAASERDPSRPNEREDVRETG